MPLKNQVLKLYLEDWKFNMTDEDVKRKIGKVVIASRNAIDPSFRSYWQNTAKTLATKYNVNLSEIENNLELYNESETSRLH